jgi:transcriptional regulator with XRE-family HTH domain
MAKKKLKLGSAFPERLKGLREHRSLNVAEFAKLIKVSPAAIWHWENKGTVPRKGTLDLIAEVLGVSRTFLEDGNQLNGEIPSEPIRKTAGDELSLEQLIRAIEVKGFEVSIKSKR